MQLTKSNYFSKEADMYYMSASQFKNFKQCESMALAVLNGQHDRKPTDALLIGSYVDAYFTDDFNEFIKAHPEIFKKDGQPKSGFLQADYIIERIKRDDMFMRYLSGQHQVIITGEIAGVPFKGLIDSYHPGTAIVDLKIMRDMNPIWKDGSRMSFVEAWGYDIQGAIYQKNEGNKLPFIMAVATKEEEPDIALLSVPQERLDYCLAEVIELAPRYHRIKLGEIQPVGCGVCNWCRKNKILTDVIDYSMINYD